MKKRIARFAALLCALCLLLGGCQSREEGAPAASLTLPPVNLRRTAPENDVNQNYTQSALLYLPSLDGSQLIAFALTVPTSPLKRFKMLPLE